MDSRYFTRCSIRLIFALGIIGFTLTAVVAASSGNQTRRLVQVQSDGAIHQVVALIGIGALVLLAGGLLLRNRLEGDSDQPNNSLEQPQTEFLTDSERVQRLITENGGRMKQSEIVNSVEWSKAKVSRLLADLESDGQITKLRLGRENLICLRGEEPAASKSPNGGENE